MNKASPGNRSSLTIDKSHILLSVRISCHTLKHFLRCTLTKTKSTVSLTHTHTPQVRVRPLRYEETVELICRQVGCDMLDPLVGLALYLRTNGEIRKEKLETRKSTQAAKTRRGVVRNTPCPCRLDSHQNQGFPIRTAQPVAVQNAAQTTNKSFP